MNELERIETNYGCLQEYYRYRAEEEDCDKSENNEDLDDYDIFIESFYSEYGY